MLLASENVSATVHASRVPLLEGALDCVRAGHFPGGLKANRDFAECMVEYDGQVPEELKTILFDPQTAGGLLICVDPAQSTNLATSLSDAGVAAAEIGRIESAVKPSIKIEA